jgi:uncharacterized membrane protein YhdT
MAESPADKIRSENILTLTGPSIATSTILFFLSSYVPSRSFYFGPPVSLLTIIYHGTILILLRRHRDSPYSSAYPFMRPAIGLAIFLLLAWLMTATFMLYSLAAIKLPTWWETPLVVMVRATACLAVVETGVLLSLVILCGGALKSREVAEQEGRIQI